MPPQVGGTVDLELRIAEDKAAAAAAVAAQAAAAAAEAVMKAETQERLFDGRAGPLMWVDLRGGGSASLLSDDGIGAIQVTSLKAPSLTGITAACCVTPVAQFPQQRVVRSSSRRSQWLLTQCRERASDPCPTRARVTVLRRCLRCGHGACAQRTRMALPILSAASPLEGTLSR